MLEEKQEENRTITELIEAGSEIAGSVSGALIGAAIFGPVGIITGGAAGPILTRLFTKAGKEVKKRILGDREEARIGFTYAFGLNKIKCKLESGEKLRDDGFFDSDVFDRSVGDEILDGVLRSAQVEYQEKKLPYYGNLLANIAFDSSINEEKANLFLKIAQNLSYYQLCIIQFASQYGQTKLYWGFNFERIDELQKYSSLEPSIEELSKYKLLIVMKDGESLMQMKISKLGLEFANLMELNSIDKNVITSIEIEFSAVKKIIEKNKKL
ncbi:MAG: hypothetical protein HOO86_15055 [Bacteroidales bacterium]|nr:hypothetical protein [Bacteroidales bacterium]